MAEAGEVMQAIGDCFAFTLFMVWAIVALRWFAKAVHADAERGAKPKFRPPPDPLA
jgi:hypothetical protein